MVSASAALNFGRARSGCPTVSKPPSTARMTAALASVSSPGCGTARKFLYALVSVRLTRLPQLATSSSLFLRTNSAQVKSVSCVSGPAAREEVAERVGVVRLRKSPT